MHRINARPVNRSVMPLNFKEGMTSVYSLAIATLFLTLGLICPRAVAQNDFPARADALMNGLVERDRFSGSVLIAQNGKVLFEKGYGPANREWDIPNSPQTKFRIASLTKQFTAAALLSLQERGKLKVTDAISSYVADLPPSWRRITIHQLLTHPSGLPEYTQPPEVEKTLNLTGASPEQLLSLVKSQPLAFAPGNAVIGDLSRVFLRGVGLEPNGTIPHLLFMCYQGTFCIITAALISGAIVERMRFGAYVTFITLWAVVVYGPIAHWVWGGGWLSKMGALDFAGGTVVHVNAGMAALVAALVVGKRRDYPSSSLLPHNVPFTLLGAGVLWFGWFGFNAGSAVAANGIAGLAFTTTVRTMGAMLTRSPPRRRPPGRRRNS